MLIAFTKDGVESSKFISCNHVSPEVEMTANWETFALSLSVGRYPGQLSASGWKRIA